MLYELLKATDVRKSQKPDSLLFSRLLTSKYLKKELEIIFSKTLLTNCLLRILQTRTTFAFFYSLEKHSLSKQFLNIKFNDFDTAVAY